MSIEKQVFFQNAPHQLSGTLTIPDIDSERHPAVLIIPGAGYCDRDGNVDNLKLQNLKLLAELLTKNGYITLRYDKRGVGNSSGDYYETGLSDFLNDAICATKYLKRCPDVDENQVIILGHSEGAIISPAIYEQEIFHGLILLCGTSSPGSDIMPLPGKKVVEEIRKTSGFKGAFFKMVCLDKVVSNMWDYVNHKALAAETPSIKLFGLKKFNAKWLKESYAFDVRIHLAEIDCPTLVIGGEKDIQADPNEVEEIAELIPGPTTSKVINNMNHILFDYEGEHKFLTCMQEYKDCTNKSLSAVLCQTITTWLQQQTLVPQSSDNKGWSRN